MRIPAGDEASLATPKQLVAEEGREAGCGLRPRIFRHSRPGMMRQPLSLPVNKVLEDFVQGMANVQVAVCVWRAIMQGEGRLQGGTRRSGHRTQSDAHHNPSPGTYPRVVLRQALVDLIFSPEL